MRRASKDTFFYNGNQCVYGKTLKKDILHEYPQEDASLCNNHIQNINSIEHHKKHVANEWP